MHGSQWLLKHIMKLEHVDKGYIDKVKQNLRNLEAKP